EGRVLGLWFPLDDVTEENGCLQCIPGSHKNTPVTKHYVRTHSKDGPMLTYRGDAEYISNPDPSKYVKLPVKKGACVLIHGLVVHKSEPNTSPFPRKVYTFHLYERGKN